MTMEEQLVLAGSREWRAARMIVIKRASEGGQIGSEAMTRLATAEHALSAAVLGYERVIASVPRGTKTEGASDGAE